MWWVFSKRHRLRRRQSAQAAHATNPIKIETLRILATAILQQPLPNKKREPQQRQQQQMQRKTATIVRASYSVTGWLHVWLACLVWSGCQPVCLLACPPYPMCEEVWREEEKQNKQALGSTLPPTVCLSYAPASKHQCSSGSVQFSQCALASPKCWYAISGSKRNIRFPFSSSMALIWFFKWPTTTTTCFSQSAKQKEQKKK